MSRSTPARRARRRRAVAAPAIAAALAASVAAIAPTAHAAPPAPAAQPRTSPVTVHRSPLTRQQVEQLTRNATSPVIVLLRDQSAGTLGNRARLARRSDALARSQSRIVAELRTLHTPGLRQYRFVNAVAGTVSSAEAARLRTDPAVLAVVPDRLIALPKSETHAASAAVATPAAAVNRTAGVCGTAKHPLLEPEALSLIHADTPHHGNTGAGVKIACSPTASTRPCRTTSGPTVRT